MATTSFTDNSKYMLIRFLAAALLLTGLFLSGCKSHIDCPAYSKSPGHKKVRTS